MSHFNDHPVELTVGKVYLNRDRQKVKIVFKVPEDDPRDDHVDYYD